MSVFCPQCKALNDDEAPSCWICGIALHPAPVATQTLIPPSPIPMQQQLPPGYGFDTAMAKPVEYAGFWLRFVAYLIDYCVLMVPGTIIGGIAGLIIGLSAAAHGPAAMNTSEMTGTMVLLYCIIIPITLVINWLYYALMESSATQGTLGKMALGLKVTDLDGNRISFSRASGRFFAKIISVLILLIGYIMAGTTEKKQALHDTLASCLVVKK